MRGPPPPGSAPAGGRPLLPAGFGRGDGEEIHTPVRQVAAEPGERSDFIVERKIQLSGCRHSRRTIAALISDAASKGWRRGRDSNPRAGYPARRFRGAPVTTTSVPLRLLLRSGQSPSLRARGRLRRLPSGARLRPQALYYYARGKAPRCALAVAFGDSPPALACGRRRFITTLGAKPLAARSRSPSAAVPSGASRCGTQALYYRSARGKAPRCALAVAFG